jgi:hypothetical protein
MDISLVSIAELDANAKEHLNRLQAVGIQVQVHKLGEKHYSCRARFDDGRDPQVSYAVTPDQSVQQTFKTVQSLCSDLFPQQPN